MAQTCPYTEICDIYKNWVEQTNDKRLDIIIKPLEAYECLAKTALEDPPSEGGIIPNEKIKMRLKSLFSPCSHITLLNLLDRLTK